MNIRDLEYIVAVSKEESFTKAAQKSFISQPTLSMQIDKLETNLGVELFERSRGNFLITDAGEEIINKAQIILREVDEIKKIAKKYSNPLEGEIKIGAFPTLAPYLFPKISNNIHKNFKKLQIFLIEEKTEILINKLSKGEIDLAILSSPIEDNSLENIPLFKEEFLLAVAKNNKLAKKKKITAKDLLGEKIMLLDEGHCLRNQALEICAVTGAIENQNFRASSLETLIEMVKINHAITLVPQISAKKHKHISYLKISKAPTRQIALYYRKTASNKILFEQIAQIIKNNI